MSCRNPKNEIFAKKCETLETLQPKIQNSQNCNMRVVGGVLREVVHPYAIFIPNVQVLSAETPKNRGSYKFSGNPRRVVRFCRRERTARRSLCNGFFKTYALKPCWIFTMLGSSMRLISILTFTWIINKCSYTIHNCCNNQDHMKKYHA